MWKYLNLILGERSTLHIEHQRITKEIAHLFALMVVHYNYLCALDWSILEINDFGWDELIEMVEFRCMERYWIKSKSNLGVKIIIIMSLNDISTFMNVHE